MDFGFWLYLSYVSCFLTFLESDGGVVPMCIGNAYETLEIGEVHLKLQDGTFVFSMYWACRRISSIWEAFHICLLFWDWNLLPELVSATLDLFNWLCEILNLVLVLEFDRYFKIFTFLF